MAPHRRDPMTTVWSWRAAPAVFRTLARWVILVQLVGYTVSLVFVWQTTRLLPAGVAARYRGAPTDTATTEALQFPKSFSEMLTITHTHLLGMGVLFTITGLCLAMCTRPGERWRRFLIVEPFAALLTSFFAMWLMRYVDGRFAWLLEVSSASLAVVFYIQSWYVLRELTAISREGRTA
jgi:hypothetical protein